MEDASVTPTAAEIASGRRTLADLDADALTHCAALLGLQDLSRMAMACKTFRQVAYSDSIWRRLFRETWPQNFIPVEASGARAAYLERRTAIQQFKFDDPLTFNIPAYALPQSHLLFDNDDFILAQGSTVQILKVDASTHETACETIRAHNARITCVRLFPLSETFLYRNEAQKNENVMVTSSSDHTIRLWWKGRSQRCFKGHNIPVTTLADGLLGKSGTKLLASGGEDGSVRLWCIGSSAKRQPLVATFHGHERPISFLTVAGHNPSLLVSISKDAKLRVWDTTTATTSASRSSSCVGTATVSGHPIGIKCHESLCYVASGASVTVIDLRTMKKLSAIAIHPPKLHSFAMVPSKSLICTGGKEKAMLWDLRKVNSIAVLDGHVGPVTMVHADAYKVVTGGPNDLYVKVWEVETGAAVRALECCSGGAVASVGLSVMAVDGCRMVTGGYGDEPELLCFRDYSNSSVLMGGHEQGLSSKFWEEPSSFCKDLELEGDI